MSTGKHIVLDVGHANGTGACGHGLEEHAVCAELAVLLKRLLVLRGFTVSVIDYPDSTNRADLVATVKAANGISRAAFGISLHMDAASTTVEEVDEEGEIFVRHEVNPEPHGAHVCYVSNTGKRMAEAIAKWLCTLLPGRASKTVKRGDLYILKNTRAPWVLVECGFLSNEADAAMLRDNLPGVAAAINQGVCDYFTA